MCGICGVLTRDESAASQRPFVESMMQLMQRRGPDDSGFWTDGLHVAFGFRRLSVIDLSPAGHQPMLSACGRYAIVFNGELYNYRALREDLRLSGRVFRSATDTEVVLEALALWGVRALEKFNGMFALAWYDTIERKLILARDPMGIKPLYFMLTDRGLVFGSQYDQLIRHPFCDRSDIRLDALGMYLRLGYVPAPHGLVGETRQLRAGEYLSISPGQRGIVNSYHQMPYASKPDLTGGAAVDAVEEVVAQAVRRQMVSDVPIGAFLSGGVDSPLVAAMMQRAATEVLPAFTIGSTDPKHDESAMAAAFATRLGLQHHIRTFTVTDCLELLDDLTAAYSEPFADYSALPSLMLSRIARERVTVALSGDGGDELFWGYPRFRRILGARPLFHLPRMLRLAIYGAGKHISRPLPQGIKYKNLGQWYLHAHSGLTETELAEMAPGASHLPEDFDSYSLDTVPKPDELAQWMRHNELVGHLQMVLLKMDRASMYHGLEVRVPLLDLDVVKCAARICPSACMDEHVGKLVLRRVLRRAVQPMDIPQQKKGFDVPVAGWLRHELRHHVEELLLNRDPFPHGVFSRVKLRSLYDQHLRGADRSRALWTLLSLQLWSQHHLQPLRRDTDPRLSALRV